MNKSDILAKLTLGKDKTETVKIEDVEIELRPLTSGELSKLQSVEKKGFVMKIGMDKNGKRTGEQTVKDMDVNAGEFSEYQTEALYKAVAWSMDIDEEDVKDFAVGIPEKIFGEVIRISNLSDEDLTVIKQFRKKE